MTPLETALVVLVIIWILIFVLLAVTIVILLISLKQALNKINNILSQSEEIARGLGAVGKITAGGLAGLLIKTVGDRLRKTTTKKR